MNEDKRTQGRSPDLRSAEGTKIMTIIVALLCLWLLAGCSGSATDQPPTVIEPTADLEPTPTLANGLAGAIAPPPTPPITPFATVLAGVESLESAEGSGDSGTAIGPPPTPASTRGPAANAPLTSDDDEPAGTATPVPTPTHTPQPAERLTIGQTHLHNENYAAAAEQFRTYLTIADSATREQRLAALYGLGLAYLRAGGATEAVDTFNEALALATAEGEGLDEETAALYFHLAQGYQLAGNCPAAIGAYESYLADNPDMAAYVYPRIAECHAILGDREATVAAYEAALASAAHRIVIVAIRQQLAGYYLEDEDYAAAVAQYDGILAVAQTENTRGQALYQAGAAELLAGNTEAAYARYQEAVNDYPRAYESYLALIALLEAEQPVDPFQRGLVDYYARAYEPAVEAFSTYLAENPDTHREDVHLYLAWSYEQAGNVEAAVAEMDAYIEAMAADPAEVERGWLEKAEILVRTGRTQAAIETYQTFWDTYPASGQAPVAAWWVALLTERSGDTAGAAALYRQLAEAYPAYEDTPRALFRAGLMDRDLGNQESAVATWELLANNYPNHEFGAAAMVWLVKTLPADAAAPYLALAANQSGSTYYSLRAYHLASGIEPFEPASRPSFNSDEAAEQAEAEAWLANWLGLESAAGIGELSPELAADPRLIVGRKLWQLGLYEEAKRELEALRADYSQDVLGSYQLAIFFRDLGLYRSSIVAAATVTALTGTGAFDAPRFIARLSYPTYYDDLVVPLARRYGYDPLLQFALIRQESLFESFATSSAVAQGLSQVIPDTGAYIADELNWPDYENADLYRPYVGVAFGAYYLDEQIEAFDGNVSAALAAYNGGPGNAARWLNLAPDDHDRFLQVVSFAETRTYIERIYVGHAVYRYLYGEESDE
jgi:soluble lytic murein transglycosylase